MTLVVPTIEALIVGYENASTIGHTIASLARIDNADVSVAVHDNSSGAETLRVAEEASARARFPFRGEHCASNCGYGRGINSLSLGSSADLLLLLNPDARITTWSSPPLPSGREIVGPRVYDPNGRLVVSWGPRRTVLEDALLRLPLVSRLHVRRLVQMERDPHLGFISGVAMLIPRAFFEELGGFDPRYFLYYEDVDFCARAVESGGTLSISPRWCIAHTEGHSWENKRYEQLREEYVAGQRYFSDRGDQRAYGAICSLNAALRWVGGGRGSRSPFGRNDYGRLLAEIRGSGRLRASRQA